MGIIGSKPRDKTINQTQELRGFIIKNYNTGAAIANIVNSDAGYQNKGITSALRVSAPESKHEGMPNEMKNLR
jgi:hypothetical protein